MQLSNKPMRAAPVLMLAGVIAACATRKPVTPLPLGEVAVRAIDSAAGDSYQAAAKGEAYDYPNAFEENSAPQYPANLLAARLPPVAVKVRLIVDAGGSVTDISALDDAATVNPAFLQSVQSAALTWRFSPLVKMEGGPGKTAIFFHGWTMTYEGRATALPFHRDYEFTFAQRDGKGFVSSSSDQSTSRP